MRNISFLVIFVLLSLYLDAQNIDDQYDKSDYFRSSWHNVLVHHSDQKYADEIIYTYNIRPRTDKFNDHSISADLIAVSGKDYVKLAKIDKYIETNDVAKELVAKWFNRNEENGCCDMGLIYRRGIEGATTENIETSELTKRGRSILQDCGTDLIGNTFVLVHDIIYIDKAERNKKTAEGIGVVGSLLKDLGEVVAEVTGEEAFEDLGSAFDDLSKTTADMVDDFEGFRVKIQTHLYRLDWQPSYSDIFFENYYLDANYYDEDKYKSWENAEYQLVYIGTQEAVCGKTVLAGIYNQSDLIKKVIYRTLDESIVKLQKNYEVFRIKEPIYSIDSEGNVIAKIGLKEGISDNSKFEVIERIEASDGTIKYKRLGVIQPNPDKIWDNRYMAVEEGAVNADLEGTTFSVVSGHGFYPGLLIREIRF